MMNKTVDADASLIHISSQQQTNKEETLQKRLKYCLSGTGGSSLRWNGGKEHSSKMDFHAPLMQLILHDHSNESHCTVDIGTWHHSLFLDAHNTCSSCRMSGVVSWLMWWQEFVLSLSWSEVERHLSPSFFDQHKFENRENKAHWLLTLILLE